MRKINWGKSVCGWREARDHLCSEEDIQTIRKVVTFMRLASECEFLGILNPKRTIPSMGSDGLGKFDICSTGADQLEEHLCVALVEQRECPEHPTFAMPYATEEHEVLRYLKIQFVKKERDKGVAFEHLSFKQLKAVLVDYHPNDLNPPAKVILYEQ